MDAARFWASGGAGDGAQLHADLEAFGMAPPAPADERFGVFEENVATVELFLEARTQWCVATGMGGMLWLGLNYGGLQALLEGWPRRKRAALFAGVRAMESAALGVLNRKA